MEVRINRIMMSGKKRKSFSWIRGGCSQVDQGSGWVAGGARGGRAEDEAGEEGRRRR
jgi:hypothetical protein